MSRSRLGTALLLSASVYAACGAGMAQAVPLQTLRGGNSIVTFDSATPGTASSTVTVSGLGAGQTLSSIDYRPGPLATSPTASRRLLYGISNTGQLYAMNGTTGAAVAVGATPAVPLGLLGATATGFDFNPTVDRIRLITNTRLDYRLNPDTGALAATDGLITYAATDPNAAATPTVTGAAYTNNVPGATTTTLYVIDTANGTAPARLATQGNATVSPNSGTLFTVGSTGVVTNNNVGFDITSGGTAYATLTNPTTGVTTLYQVNLATGTATSLGALAGNTTYNGLASPVLAPFATMGASANQRAVGAALDNFTVATGGVLGASVAGLFNGIDSLVATPGAQAAALQQLSPAAFSQLPDIALNAVEVQENVILRYTRDLRGNAESPDGARATLDEAGRLGVWLSGGSRFGRFKGADNRYGADTDEFHFLGGVDFRLTPTVALGGFYGYSKTNGNTARLPDRVANGVVPAAKADLRSFFGGGYATAAVGPFYVDAWGSYTDLDFALERTIAIGSYSNSLRARASKGRVWTGGAATGLSFQFNNFEIEPFAAVRYSDIRIRGFTEVANAGGGAANAGGLTVGDFDRVSLRTNVGGRVGTKFEVAGATIRPQVRGGWYHEFRDQARTITAAFNTPGLSATPFNFTTTPLSGDYFNVGGALNISGNGPLSLVADYDAQFDDDREFYTLTIGVRLAL